METLMEYSKNYFSCGEEDCKHRESCLELELNGDWNLIGCLQILKKMEEEEEEQC